MHATNTRQARVMLILTPLLFFSTWIGMQGRPVQEWTPEELAGKAQVICTGTPIKVVVSDQKSGIQLPFNDSLPVRTVIATIKVLGVTKGNAPDQIEVRYPNLDMAALAAKGINGVTDGPTQIYLTAGNRYRFYLNPSPSGSFYVGALSGAFDDGGAVQELGIAEDASRPPLLKDEAVRIATRYLREKRPSFAIKSKWITPRFEGFSQPPRWIVQFDEKESSKYPEFTYGAEIIVDADRTIDPDSWIAIASASQDWSSLTGKYVRLVYQSMPNGGISILRGHVKSVTGFSLTLVLSENDMHFQMNGADRPVDRMELLLPEIRGVSVLLE